MLKIDYRLEEVFVTFVEIDINCHEFKEFNPRTVNRLIQKWNTRVSENYRMEANGYVFYSYCC